MSSRRSNALYFARFTRIALLSAVACGSGNDDAQGTSRSSDDVTDSGGLTSSAAHESSDASEPSLSEPSPSEPSPSVHVDSGIQGPLGPDLSNPEPHGEGDAGSRDTTVDSSHGSEPSGATDAGNAGPAPWRMSCGNGTIDPGELCDDANLTAGDGCDFECCRETNLEISCVFGWTSAHADACHCGDGFLQTDEQCDDGNLDFGDGCSGYCEIEPGTCGNAELDQGEFCDDGNLEPYDGCDPGCYQESRCDLQPSPSFEPDAGHVELDSGNANCGNSVVESAESCDDGNTTAGDGCDSHCTLECGNGHKDTLEECDDGNRLPGDGCGPDCQNEPIIEN
jgi:cysteine-rich repeat protein